MSKNEFKKYDSGKPNLAVLFDAPKALAEVSKIISYGAEKYDRKNWRSCPDNERFISATLRHLSAYLSGEKLDVESGLPHLAHAITSLLFVLDIEQAEERKEDTKEVAKDKEPLVWATDDGEISLDMPIESVIFRWVE